MNGDYTFTLDGDYIVNVSDEGDFSAYAIMTYLKESVADYYGMNNLLMTGYIAGLENAGLEQVFIHRKRRRQNNDQVLCRRRVENGRSGRDERRR